MSNYTKTYKPIRQIVSITGLIYFTIFAIVITARLQFIIGTFPLDIVRVLYILALPLIVLFLPFGWFYSTFGNAVGLISEFIGIAIILVPVLWAILHLPNRWLIKIVGVIFALWLSTYPSIRIIDIFNLSSLPIDELFWTSQSGF